MTATEGATDRKVNWLRRIALILTGFWVFCWTLSLLAMALLSAFMHWATFPHTSPPLDMWLALALLVLPSWIGAAIPWRSERVGGVVLVAIGVLLFTLAARMWVHPAEGFVRLFAPFLILGPPPLLPGFYLLLFAGLPLAAGSLFLASWRISKAPESSHDGAQGRK